MRPELPPKSRGGFKAESFLGHITGKASSPFPSPPSPLLLSPPYSSLPSLFPPLPSVIEVGPSNPARRSGGAVSSPSGVWGEAPAEIEFGAF